MARHRPIERETAPRPGQVGMVYGQVRRASIDLAVLKEDPIPFATLCGDWLTAAGFPAGRRYAAISSKPGLITLVAVPDGYADETAEPSPRSKPHRGRR
jgi:hypothetical protein